VAGFANLSNMPVGDSLHTHWGEPVTVFHTASGTPYYFNFHSEAVGHTCITGPDDSGKRVLMHFLLAQSLKFKPSIFYFDFSGEAEAFSKAIDGWHLELAARASSYSGEVALFNPFALSDAESNRQFLNNWIGVLARAVQYQPTEEDKTALKLAVDSTYGVEEEKQSLLYCVEQLRNGAPAMADALAPWLPDA
jgi:type IV secretion system protein VirB4